MTYTFLTKYGFQRDTCKKCTMCYWSLNLRGLCGECDPLQKLNYESRYVPKQVSDQEILNTFITHFKGQGYYQMPSRALKLSRHNMGYVIAGICVYSPLYTNSTIYNTDSVYLDGKKFSPHKFINVQTCVRFNDFDLVGVTQRHYTNFIMLGQHIFETKNIRFDEHWIETAFTVLFEFIRLYIPDLTLWTIQQSTWTDQIHEGDSLEIFINGIELFNQVYTVRNYADKTNLDNKYVDMGGGLYRFIKTVLKKEHTKESLREVVLKDHLDSIILMYRSGVYIDKRGVGHTLRQLLERVLSINELKIVTDYIEHQPIEQWIKRALILAIQSRTQ